MRVDPPWEERYRDCQAYSEEYNLSVWRPGEVRMSSGKAAPAELEGGCQPGSRLTQTHLLLSLA